MRKSITAHYLGRLDWYTWYFPCFLFLKSVFKEAGLRYWDLRKVVRLARHQDWRCRSMVLFHISLIAKTWQFSRAILYRDADLFEPREQESGRDPEYWALAYVLKASWRGPFNFLRIQCDVVAGRGFSQQN